MRIKCDNCGEMYRRESELERVGYEIPDLVERVDEGGPMPVGECNECGSLCYWECTRCHKAPYTEYHKCDLRPAAIERLVGAVREVEHSWRTPELANAICKLKRVRRYTEKVLQRG